MSIPLEAIERGLIARKKYTQDKIDAIKTEEAKKINIIKENEEAIKQLDKRIREIYGDFNYSQIAEIRENRKNFMALATKDKWFRNQGFPHPNAGQGQMAPGQPYAGRSVKEAMNAYAALLKENSLETFEDKIARLEKRQSEIQAEAQPFQSERCRLMTEMNKINEIRDSSSAILYLKLEMLQHEIESIDIQLKELSLNPINCVAAAQPPSPALQLSRPPVASSNSSSCSASAVAIKESPAEIEPGNAQIEGQPSVANSSSSGVVLIFSNISNNSVNLPSAMPASVNNRIVFE